MRKKNNQSGRTMLEAMLVISIIVALSAGLAKIINAGVNRYRISSTTSQLFDMRKAIKARYMAIGNYSNLDGTDTNTLITDKIISRAMGARAGNGVVNVYGNVLINVGLDTDNREVDIRNAYSLDAAAPDDRYFSITYTDLPRDACVALLNIDWPHSGSTGIMAVFAQGGGGATLLGANIDEGSTWIAGDRVRFPLSVDEIVNICTDSNNNRISWYFY